MEDLGIVLRGSHRQRSWDKGLSGYAQLLVKAQGDYKRGRRMNGDVSMPMRFLTLYHIIKFQTISVAAVAVAAPTIPQIGVSVTFSTMLVTAPTNALCIVSRS